MASSNDAPASNALQQLVVAPAHGWEAQRRREFMYGLWPALILLVLVTLLPTIYLIVTSLTPLNPTNPGSELDFSDPVQNYLALLQDPRVQDSVWVQVRLSVFTV